MLKRKKLLSLMLGSLVGIFVFIGSFMFTENYTLAAYSDESQTMERMVLVEAGTTSSDNGSVTVENDFYIGRYHVTQAEFEAVMDFNPSYFRDENYPNLRGNSDNRPVENVSWYDAVMYCNKLSELEGLDKYYNISDIEYYGDEGKWGGLPNNIRVATVTINESANGYRLPTRYEHEYAARGGKNGDATRFAGSDVLEDVGWFAGNSTVANGVIPSNRGTMPVGEKKANEIGIYDMSGNVYDWTNTVSGSNYIRRGGCWNFCANYTSVGYGSFPKPSRRNLYVGFRLARSL